MPKKNFDAHVQVHLLAEKIKLEVVQAASAGLNAGRIFLAARIKETISVPAPRRQLASGKYVATVKAIAGAPIRKLSGRARQGVTSRMVGPGVAVVGVIAKSELGFNYPKYHEVPQAGSGGGKHRFIEPTVKQYMAALKTIISSEVVEEFNESISK